ncbi:hypothetical protein O3P69_004335 [Scylla paramamosain]|uniref:Endonuclease/exonuclease/phosphatase domain-containing protein n=1 Tax=Scylla paramamosain TaxID=85552 RepID=A0AAW0UFP3_SCYPA
MVALRHHERIDTSYFSGVCCLTWSPRGSCFRAAGGFVGRYALDRVGQLRRLLEAGLSAATTDCKAGLSRGGSFPQKKEEKMKPYTRDPRIRPRSMSIDRAKREFHRDSDEEEYSPPNKVHAAENTKQDPMPSTSPHQDQNEVFHGPLPSTSLQQDQNDGFSYQGRGYVRARRERYEMQKKDDSQPKDSPTSRSQPAAIPKILIPATEGFRSPVDVAEALEEELHLQGKLPMRFLHSGQVLLSPPTQDLHDIIVNLRELKGRPIHPQTAQNNTTKGVLLRYPLLMPLSPILKNSLVLAAERFTTRDGEETRQGKLHSSGQMRNLCRQARHEKVHPDAQRGRRDDRKMPQLRSAPPRLEQEVLSKERDCRRSARLPTPMDGQTQTDRHQQPCWARPHSSRRNIYLGEKDRTTSSTTPRHEPPDSDTHTRPVPGPGSCSESAEDEQPPSPTNKRSYTHQRTTPTSESHNTIKTRPAGNASNVCHGSRLHAGQTDTNGRHHHTYRKGGSQSDQESASASATGQEPQPLATPTQSVTRNAPSSSGQQGKHTSLSKHCTRKGSPRTNTNPAQHTTTNNLNTNAGTHNEHDTNTDNTGNTDGQEAVQEEQRQKQTLSILQWNCHSILNKHYLLMAAAQVERWDIILLQETSITETTPIRFPGYTAHHLPARDRRTLGCSILVRQNIRSERIAHPVDCDPGLNVNDRERRLVDAFHRAANTAIPKTKKPQRNYKDHWYYDQRVKEYHHQVNQARKLNRAHHTQATRDLLRAAIRTAREGTKKIRSEKWIEWCSGMNAHTTLSALWKHVNTARGRRVPAAPTHPEPEREASRLLRAYVDRASNAQLSHETRTRLEEQRPAQDATIRRACEQQHLADTAFTMRELKVDKDCKYESRSRPPADKPSSTRNEHFLARQDTCPAQVLGSGQGGCNRASPRMKTSSRKRTWAHTTAQGIKTLQVQAPLLSRTTDAQHPDYEPPPPWQEPLYHFSVTRLTASKASLSADDLTAQARQALRAVDDADAEIYFTDGSVDPETYRAAAAFVHCDNTGIFRLPDHSSTLQTELAAIDAIQTSSEKPGNRRVSELKLTTSVYLTLRYMRVSQTPLVAGDRTLQHHNEHITCGPLLGIKARATP